MKPAASIGTLQIGEGPFVVGTITSSVTLKSFAGRPIEACDIAEVRLDQVGQPEDWLSLSRQIERAGTPVILTTRVRSEGGNWPDDDKSRLYVIREGLQHLAAVDVEFKSAFMPEVCAEAKRLKKAAIVSFHDFQKTPSFSDLKAIIRKASSYGTIVKISAMVNSDEDTATLQNLLGAERDFPLCVIGMGPMGTKTRITFPANGSCLTYGYLDAPSAPGQLSAEQLSEHLRLISK
ncbi:MAG TPA: type I 3-dehydroquinate dehydratase [Verrucomicrobiae bacterium]|nr:type I 3-dehydroquinate dehydratase [Verrucomicrobiae bacterium]